MLKEYYIWKKIFEDSCDYEIEDLIKLVIMDNKARSYVFDKILEVRNRPKEVFKININIDKNLKNFPTELLISKISTDIIDQIKDIEITKNNQ